MFKKRKKKHVFSVLPLAVDFVAMVSLGKKTFSVPEFTTDRLEVLPPRDLPKLFWETHNPPFSWSFPVKVQKNMMGFANRQQIHMKKYGNTMQTTLLGMRWKHLGHPCCKGDGRISFKFLKVFCCEIRKVGRDILSFKCLSVSVTKCFRNLQRLLVCPGPVMKGCTNESWWMSKWSAKFNSAIDGEFKLLTSEVGDQWSSEVLVLNDWFAD